MSADREESRLDLPMLPEFLRRLEIVASLNGRTVEAEAALILHRGIVPNPDRAAELASIDLEKLDDEERSRS